MHSFTCYFVHSVGALVLMFDSRRLFSDTVLSIYAFIYYIYFIFFRWPSNPCKFFYWINNICNSIGENEIFSHCVDVIAICHLGRFCWPIYVQRPTVKWYDSDDESPNITLKSQQKGQMFNANEILWNIRLRSQRSNIVTTIQSLDRMYRNLNMFRRI